MDWVFGAEISVDCVCGLLSIAIRQCETLCNISMRLVAISELLCEVTELLCEVSRLHCDVTGLLPDKLSHNYKRCSGCCACRTAPSPASVFWGILTTGSNCLMNIEL